MQNNFFTKTDNIFINKLSTINLTALSVFLIYFLSVTLLPIANGIINTRQDNLSVNRNNNINFYAQVLKLKTKTNDSAFTIDTTTYINNGQMLARQIDDNNLQSYVNDAKGSVLKLNSADKSQDQIYSYDAYGKPIANITKANSTLNVINSLQYNGERFDNNTNLQYLRARFYNPETKRFINQDAYNLLNRFGYVNSNSVMGVDPTGHNAGDWIKDAWSSATNWIADQFKNHTLAASLITSGIVVGTGLGLGLGLSLYKWLSKKNLKTILTNGKRLGEGSYGAAYLYQEKVYKIPNNTLTNNEKIISSPDRAARLAKEVSKVINKGKVSAFAASMEATDVRTGIFPWNTRRVLRMDYIEPGSRFNGNYDYPCTKKSHRTKLDERLNCAGYAMFDNNKSNVFKNEFERAEPADYDLVYTRNSVGRRLSIGSEKVHKLLEGNGLPH